MAATASPVPAVASQTTKTAITTEKPSKMQSQQNDVEIKFLNPIDKFRPVDTTRIRNYFIVKARVDEDGMRTALDKLIRNHLPVLGGQIKETGKDKALAYHHPKTFPEDAVLFEWSSVTVDVRLDDANVLPSKRTEDAVHFGPANVLELESKWAPASWSPNFKAQKSNSQDPGRPLLLVHLTRYLDATIVGVSLPHSMSDQMGFTAFIEAWMEVVQGGEPAPFLELGAEAFEGGRKFTRKELEVKGAYRAMSKIDRKKCYAMFIRDLITHPKEARRLLVVPESVVKRLQKEAIESLKATYGEDIPHPSSGDILAGIITKLNFLGEKGPTKVSLGLTVNGRGRIPALPASKPYLHNCLYFALAQVNVTDELPVAEIAYRNRLQLIETFKEESLQRCYAVQKELVRRNEMMLGVEPRTRNMSLINWHSAWRGLDFGPAMSKTSDSTAPSSEGLAMVGCGMMKGMPTRGVSVFFCKTDGNYWCDLTVHTDRMVLVEKLLESNPTLEGF